MLLLLQMAFAVLHVPVPPLALEQQAVPRSPHLAQVPALHFVPGAVQAPVLGFEPQQGRPGPPHVPQAPALQVPPPRPMQLPPTAMQIPVTQQPPLLQLLPSQHCVPGSPQTSALPPAPPCVGPIPPPTPPPPSPPFPMGVPLSSTCTPPSRPMLDPPHPWMAKAAPPAIAKMHTTKYRLVLVTRVLLGADYRKRRIRRAIHDTPNPRGSSGLGLPFRTHRLDPAQAG